MSIYKSLSDNFIDRQRRVVDVVMAAAPGFALAGGTALSLFYFQHRLSYDLDFFSAKFERTEVERALDAIAGIFPHPAVADAAFSAGGDAEVRRYILPLDLDPPCSELKIDFVEDVYPFPAITTIDQGTGPFRSTRVYEISSLYVRKLWTVAGTRRVDTSTGAATSTGRQTARDLVDLFTLSVRFRPLHKMIAEAVAQGQCDPGMPPRLYAWSRKFSRQAFAEEFPDLDLLFETSPREIFRHIDAEMDALQYSALNKP